ncbi:MAG TPA: hypothetical protein VNZ03_01025 [Terriglobales bacterium]|jgi:hypothetical protein|nr:hypothetical protein [Terriglobales bacterium]
MPDQIETPQPPASAIGEQFLANGGQPIPSQPDASQNVQPAATPPQAAPAPSPEQQAAVAQTAKHTAIGRMFSNLVGSGSGSSASSFWRSLVAGAVVGMGAAENAPVVAHGPYGDIRDSSMVGAAGRAFTAVQGNIEHQQDRQQAQARQAAEEKRRNQEAQIQMDDLSLRKAADARAQIQSIHQGVEFEKRMKMLDQTIAAGNWDEAQRSAQVAQNTVKMFNDLNEVEAQPLTGSDGQPLLFSSGADAEKAAHDNAKFFADSGNFKTRYAYDPTKNKYSVYRIPDTDIKNVQLRDPQTGEMHTIPRMSTTEYLNYQTQMQNLKKGALEIQKVSAEINRLHNDVKASSQYGEALKALTAATDKDGNVDLSKIPAGNRAVLVEHSAKGLEDALRARSGAIEKHSKAVEAGDQTAIDEANQNIEEATQIVKHYSGVLTTMTGGKTTQAGQAQGMVQYQLPNGQVGNIPADQANAFEKKNPGAKKIAGGAAPASTSPAPLSIQLSDGSTIQTAPENVPKYLRSNKGAKVADADQQRYTAWLNQQRQSDQEDRAAAAENLQD